MTCPPALEQINNNNNNNYSKNNKRKRNQDSIKGIPNKQRRYD